MDILVPIARVLFAALFIKAGLSHMSLRDPAVAYAAAAGVPAAQVTVKIAGLLALLGGLSVALGAYAQVGALMLIAFLLPVTFTLHRFWGLPDQGAAAMQKVHFEKNLSLLGGALLVAVLGSGPFSLL